MFVVKKGVPLCSRAVRLLTGLFLILINILIATNVSADTWKTEFVDSGGDIGQNTSIALDTQDRAHISYYDETNMLLKYASNSSGAWITTTIDGSGDVSDEPTSITLDSSGKVHISYCEYDGANGDDLKYATNASGTWTMMTVDSSGDVSDTSIALDTSGKVHIGYYDWSNGDLKYASNASGSWVLTTIDSSGDVGWDTSIALDTSGNAYISYFDRSNYDLKYATNVSGAWVTTTVDGSGSVGFYTSLALDSSDNAHISYYDETNGALKYTTNSEVTTATPTPTATVSPTPFTVCEAEAITVSSSGTLKLKRGKSADVTIMVTGIDNCPVEGEIVTAATNLAGRKRVSILPASKTTDENGQVTFTITALKKTGNARITFQAGSVKKILTVKVRK